MNASANYLHSGQDEFELIQSATGYSLLRDGQGWIGGRFYQCELTSVFQPVFNPGRNQTIGYAAYIRSKANGEPSLWPWQIFSMASKDEQLVELDRLCRAIHALNFYFNNTSGTDKLFVEVHPRLLESVTDDHGRAFESFLDLIGVRTSQVVIELPITINRNWELLQHVITNYRSRGYQIAANYSGTQSDWMTELGSMYPDIVRISAVDLARHPDAASLAETIHSFRASLLVKDIETSIHLVTALRNQADFLQGNMLGEPQRTIHALESAFISKRSIK